MRCARGSMHAVALGLLTTAAAGPGGVPQPLPLTMDIFASSGIDAAQQIAPPRALLLPDVAGALKVEGVPFPNQLLNGLYFPTADPVNGQTAYKKDGTSPNKLWLTKDPNGYWCIQPTSQKGSDSAFMITSHKHRSKPENAVAWQVWKDQGWETVPAIHVLRCQNHICDADHVQATAPPSHGSGGNAPGDGAPGRGSVAKPTPLAPAWDNSPGNSILTPVYLMENPADTTSSTWWAGLALMTVLLVTCTCCLLHTENQAARGYTYSTMSATTALVIGVLLSCQLVPFITFGYWRTSWVVELLLFIIGWILLHYCCWKCQFSPIRRITICLFCGYVVGAAGAVAFLDFREALFGWGYEDSVFLATWLLVGTSLFMALLHYLTKGLGQKHFAEPSPNSTPPPPEPTIISKPRSCMTARTCMGMSGADTEEKDTAKENEWAEWAGDAVWAEYVAMTTVIAFALYNFLRAVATSWTEHKIWMVWLLFVLVIIGIMAGIHTCMRRSKKKLEESGNLEGRDWHADAVILGILTRVLGLCLVGGLRKMNPGLRQQLQDWFGVSVFYGYLLELVLMSFLVLVMIAILSWVFREAESFAGILQATMNVYPMEVEGFAMVLGIVWSLFISGMLGDLVRFSSWSWITRNVAWWHALVSILMASFLAWLWKRFILRKVAMEWSDHGTMLDNEKQVYESMRYLKPSW